MNELFGNDLMASGPGSLFGQRPLLTDPEGSNGDLSVTSGSNPASSNPASASSSVEDPMTGSEGTAAGVASSTTTLEFRSITGTGNSANGYGVTGNQLIRLYENGFADGISVPRGGPFFASSLPNPRSISNIISSQTISVPNFLGASDWLWQWGQFIDHDLDLNESSASHPGEFTPIVVPFGDPTFPDGTILPFIRVTAAEGTGTGPDNPRQTTNEITSFIDASSVYGSEDERATFLRSFTGGQLKISISDNGEVLLPVNPVGDEALPNATGGTLGDFQYVAGDIRANEQVGLTAVHALFVREHNRLAADIYARLEAGEPALVGLFDQFAATSDVTDTDVLKDEFVYQAARKVVGAQIQQITYKEFLPLLIGEGTLADYDGYKAYVSADISTEFANAAYRLGHTLLSNQLQQLSTNGLSETALVDAFFAPDKVQTGGIDATLRGLILQAAQEVDNLVVDGVRNFLFPAGTGGFDLAAINIARGRDTGLPSYVEVYKLITGIEIQSFDDLPFREGLGGADGLFAQAYDSVDQIDLWIGGISEQPASHGGLLGTTFSAIVADQFERVRDGDRFFYLNEIDAIRLLDPDFDNTTLSQVLRNNTDDAYLIQDNAFEVPYDNIISGDHLNNVLFGTHLDDLINGKEGRDIINGRRGDDIILGDQGNDMLSGGQGDDTVLGGLGQDRIFGNRGSDVLLGGDDRDTISGGSGNDTVVGGRGDDRLFGGQGADQILGNAGNDLLVGGGGADTLDGGVGNDSFYGGSGPDTFVFADDIFSDGMTDTDRIVGFQRGDTLDFSGYSGSIDFNRVSRGFLEVELNGGEDTIQIFGSRSALDVAQIQLASVIA